MAQNNENNLYTHGSGSRYASITNCIHLKVFEQHAVTTVTYYARGASEGNWSLELMI
jgi:hypothetical protein